MSTETVSAGQLRAFIERIERLEEEKKTIADDIKEVKAEAKGCGFDVGAINAIIKLRKMDAAERQEKESILDIYKAALGMLPLDEYATREQFDAETGEIIEHEQPETANEIGVADGAIPTAISDRPNALAAREADESAAPHSHSSAEILPGETNSPTHSSSHASGTHSHPQPLPLSADKAGEAHPQASPASQFPRPAPIAGAGGSLSIPSGDDGGAKMDDVSASIQAGPTGMSGNHRAKSLQAATNSDDFDPERLAFLIRPPKPLRPNCLKPDNCAGYGSHTCHACTVAARESEVA